MRKQFASDLMVDGFEQADVVLQPAVSAAAIESRRKSDEVVVAARPFAQCSLKGC